MAQAAKNAAKTVLLPTCGRVNIFRKLSTFEVAALNNYRKNFKQQRALEFLRSPYNRTIAVQQLQISTRWKVLWESTTPRESKIWQTDISGKNILPRFRGENNNGHYKTLNVCRIANPIVCGFGIFQ